MTKLRSSMRIMCSLIGLLVVSSCTPENAGTPRNDSTSQANIIGGDELTEGDVADVVSVEVSGEEGAYQFSVGIKSPDEGCDHYADWWEVVSQDGELIYRRILLHSHVGEQPFVRTGGSVNISSEAIVWVRAHMHPTGYGGSAMSGSVRQGFEQADLNIDFASNLVETPPLPSGCDF